MALFFAALSLGLIFNAAPGAVFAETVRQGVSGGFRPAFAVQMGSLVGDATWAILGLLGIGLLLQLDVLRWPVGMAGVLYLLWLAFDSWRAADRCATVRPGGVRERRALRAGVLLSLTNPQNIAYWAALGSALSAVGIHEPTPRDYAVFFAGFMCSSLLWAFVCAFIVERLFRHGGERWAAATHRVCAVAFVALAVGSMRELMAHGRSADAPRLEIPTGP